MKANRVLLRQPASLLFTIVLAGSIPAYAQTAATDTTTTTTTTSSGVPATPTPAPAAVQQAPATQAPVVLTPFEVNSTKDQGYFAANTLAGTRLNNNIADLPSSVTVVTKQQLEDTASQNINDVFRYEANTQGVSTYTPTTGTSNVRSNVSDSLSGSGGTQSFSGTNGYNSALDTGNRVRGLASADLEVNNFFSIYRIPFDAYNLDALEIERGPNSIIFGTGSPAGIVNSDTTMANVERLSGEASIETGSWGKLRETFGLNVPLIKDTLGLYVAQMYDSEGFKQKPSSDITRRQYGSFTYYPFKSHKTKFSGMVEGFVEYSADPNYITPEDYVTPWLNSGKPVYNPVNDTVTYLATGKTVGPYVTSSTYPNYAGILQTNLTQTTSPYFVPTLAYDGHIVEAIYQGNLEDTFKGQQTGFNGLTASGLNDVPTQFSGLPSTATTFISTPANALVAEERMTTSSIAGVPGYSSPFLANGNPKYLVFQVPSVTSKSIYNWSTINTASMDNTITQALTYNLNFEQVILPNLTFQLAFFRQELHQSIDSPSDQANASQMFVDTNSFLLNGSPDLHEGQPYIDVYQADVYSFPEINTNWRAMLDFEPDLRGHVPSWLDWLGHHRFLGIFTQHDDVQTGLRFRPSIDAGDANYLPTTTNLAAVAGYAITGDSALEQEFFMAAPNAAPNGVATSSPGFYNRPNYGGATNIGIQTYNYVTSQWYTANVHVDSVLFSTGGLQENLQDSKTFYWESFFFDDRVVGSIGMNEDEVKNRQTIFPATNPAVTEYPNGIAPNPSLWYNEGPWTDIGGNTSTTGVVVHAFKNWAMIDGAASNGNLFAAVLRSLSFTFNKSDNFNAPPGFYTDFFGNPLGKPTGQEKDYGLEIASPDNKFFLRLTKFTTASENVLTAFTSTTRAVYLDTLMKDWATEVVEIRNGENPTLATFNNVAIFPITAAEQTQISALTGVPYNFGGNVGGTGEFVNPNGTESGTAQGYELEATYNPLPNWTMKFTWAKQQTITTGAGAVGQAWVNFRMPAWTSAVATDIPNVITLSNGNPLYLASFWQGYGFDSNVTGPGTAEPTSQAYFNNVEGSQLASDEGPNGTVAPNQVEYSWSYLTSYTIDRGPLKNLSFGGALRYTGQITAGYYGNPNVNSLGEIYGPDITHPIIVGGRYHADAFIGYQFKMPWDDKIRVKVQANVSDLTSNGYLLPVSYNYDGTPAAERIIAPRSFSLQAKFEF